MLSSRSPKRRHPLFLRVKPSAHVASALFSRPSLPYQAPKGTLSQPKSSQRCRLHPSRSFPQDRPGFFLSTYVNLNLPFAILLRTQSAPLQRPPALSLNFGILDTTLPPCIPSLSLLLLPAAHATPCLTLPILPSHPCSAVLGPGSCFSPVHANLAAGWLMMDSFIPSIP